VINNSYLLGLYGGSVDTASTSGGTATTPRKTQPTAPWAIGVKVPEQSALVRAALAGNRLINEGTERTHVPGASTDHRKPFALYKGLDSLTALATRADQRGVSASESAQIRQRFTAGMSEVSDYLRTAGFDDSRLVEGGSATTAKTTATVRRAVADVVHAWRDNLL